MNDFNEWHLEGRKNQYEERWEQAEKAYKIALQINPLSVNTLNNLTVIRRRQGRREEASKVIEIAIRMLLTKEYQNGMAVNKQEMLKTWERVMTTQSQLLLDKSDLNSAKYLSKKAIMLNPNGAGYAALGNALIDEEKYMEAIKSYIKGLRRFRIETEEKPNLINEILDKTRSHTDCAKEVCNIAYTMLQIDPLLWRNWKLSLARIETIDNNLRYSFMSYDNLWDGTYTDNLLVWDEQGFGDALQCMRWIKETCRRANKVTLLLRSSLISLIKARLYLPGNCILKDIDNVRQLTEQGISQCPLMGLPVALYREKDYICINPEKGSGGENKPILKRFKQTHAKTPKERKLGFQWRAGDKQNIDLKKFADSRSIKPEIFMKKAGEWRDNWNLKLMLMQIDIDNAELEKLMKSQDIDHLAPGDWEQTAKTVEGMDLIVTVDTAMAHLAGSLGIPSIVLLNKRHDWRWGQAGHTIYWYPKQEIMRCDVQDDWLQLLEKVEDSIAKILSEK